MHCLNLQCYDSDENVPPNELLYESYLGWLDSDPKMYFTFKLEDYFILLPSHGKGELVHVISFDRSYSGQFTDISLSIMIDRI